jgi:hypothetical protein
VSDIDLPEHSHEHKDNDIDITWHNLWAPSNFSTVRFTSTGPVEKLLVILGKIIESGLFEEIANVSASKFSIYITVVCSKSWDEVKEHIELTGNSGLL